MAESNSRWPALVLGLALLVAGAAPAIAWDSFSHRVVARLAWDELSPAVRARAVELLAAAPAEADLATLRPSAGPKPEADREFFERAATWADLVNDEHFPARRARFAHPGWHYINLFFEQREPGAPVLDRRERPPAAENVVSQLEALAVWLSDPQRPAGERGLDLAWVLHLVGDIHQPLHTSARITALEPDHDRGGNLFPLAGREDLHGFWDHALRGLGESRASVGTVARELVARYPAGSALAAGQFGRWAEEGFVLAREEAYPPELRRGHRPPEPYRQRVLAVARRRLALAGHRLAALLETLLDAEAAVPGGRASVTLADP